MAVEAGFIKAVVERLEEKWGGKKQAEVRPVTKNNGVVQTGLSLKGGKGGIRPTVSLEPYYEQYRNGMASLDEVAEDICGLLGGNEGEEGFGGDLPRYPELKEKVVFRLINRGMNRELLEEVPHVPFLDMEIVFMVTFGQNEKGQMSAIINNESMQEWRESPQSLFSQAKRNTPLLSPASLETMEAVMKKIMQSNTREEDYGEDLVSGFPEEGQEEAPASMYVLTNQRGIYGAAAMLYPELLKDFAERQKTDLVILPSSVHEVLLVPVRGSLDFAWFRCMVRSINRSEVPPEDWLSDQVYVYRRREGRVKIAE